jgi:6-phosphogluconolactonase
MRPKRAPNRTRLLLLPGRVFHSAMKFSLPPALDSIPVLLMSLAVWGWASPDARGASPGKASTRVYVGTYTGAKSKGIYQFRFDPKTGAMTAEGLAAETPSPSFLALEPAGRFLYAVNEISNYEGKKSGSVTAFAVDRATGKLTELNRQPTGGDGPCYVTVDKKGEHVLVANYGGGSVAVFPVNADGKLASASAFVQHHGSSVNPRRQEAPHAHGIYLDQANRFAFVPDLGQDKIMIYRYDATGGTLKANDPAWASVTPGSGPRHFALEPRQRFAYVISEMACTVTAFRFDPKGGRLTEFEAVSSLPEGTKRIPSYSTAEIYVHPSGKFLYGSNRGHDSIAVFSIDRATGRLTLVQHVPTAGKTPRNFAIDPSGRFLLAANQSSDSIAVFRIDPETGRLESAGPVVAAPEPVCLVFAE